MTRSQSSDETILIVRHGKNRGPRIRLRSLRPAYFQPFLSDLSHFDPQLRSRIRTWETGDPMPDLSQVEAVLFFLQDPLEQQYPACFGESSLLLQDAQRLGIPAVNPPPALSRTKTEQATIWLEAGVSTPEPHHFGDPMELYEVAETLHFPVLLKHELQHAQSGMKWVETAAELRRIPSVDLPFPGTVSSFVDVRAGYQDADPDSPYAQYFHKKRALIFGDKVATNHVFFSENPIVGFKSSTFSAGRSFNPIRRHLGLRGHQDHLQLDYDYWRQEIEHQDELLRATQALGLGFSAIDYSTLADGTCVLWEANPHFALHLWPLPIYTRKRQLKKRIHRQHTILARYLWTLLER